MRRHELYRPYPRRRHPSDRSESIRCAIQMEFYGADCFVMVQKGFPHLVIAVARTRRELLRSILALNFKRSGFGKRHVRAWAKRVGDYARGVK